MIEEISQAAFISPFATVFNLLPNISNSCTYFMATIEKMLPEVPEIRKRKGNKRAWYSKGIVSGP